MSWFNYIYPGDLDETSSYVVASGTPSCINGQYLCAINVPAIPGTNPAQPDLSTPGLEQAINDALASGKGTSTVKLRPTP